MPYSKKSSLNRDPILLDIEIDPIGTVLLDMPMCQRLRRINQLGFTDLVFDGARHSRLSHMKGVYSRVLSLFEDIAKNHKRLHQKHPGEYLNKIWGEDCEEKWSNCATIAAWAGMMHDVTHIPIGHTLEDEFSGIYVQHDSLLCPRHVNLWGDSNDPLPNTIKAILRGHQNLIPDKLPARLKDPLVLARLLHVIIMHKESRGVPFGIKVEEAQRRLLAGGNDIDEITDEQKVNQHKFLELLHGDYDEFTKAGLYEPFMTDIITDTICADLLDYLQRDTYYTGLVASYDPRILKSFVLVQEGQNLRMAVAIASKNKSMRIDIVTDVLNLMKLRHDLALKVYYHKTKVIAGAMLVKAIDLLGKKPVDGLQGDEDSITHFTMTDEGLLFWIRNRARSESAKKISDQSKNSEIALELVNSILQRRLYKTLIAIPFEGYWSKFDPEGREISNLRNDHAKICQDIAKRAECGPKDIILFIPPFKDKAKEVEARALNQDGTIVALGLHEDLKKDIDLLNENYQKLWHLYIFIHPSMSADLVKCSKIADAAKYTLSRRLPKGKTLGSKFLDHVQTRYLSLGARARLKELSRIGRDNGPEEEEMLEFVMDSDGWDQFVLDHDLSGKDTFSILVYWQLLKIIGKIEPSEGQLFTGLEERTAVFDRPQVQLRARGGAKLGLFSAVQAEASAVALTLQDKDNEKK